MTAEVEAVALAREHEEDTAAIELDESKEEEEAEDAADTVRRRRTEAPSREPAAAGGDAQEEQEYGDERSSCSTTPHEGRSYCLRERMKTSAPKRLYAVEKAEGAQRAV